MIDQGAANERAAARYIAHSGTTQHTNTCATSRAPAYEPGPCDCSGSTARGNAMGTFDKGHSHFDPTKAKERNQEAEAFAVLAHEGEYDRLAEAHVESMDRIKVAMARGSLAGKGRFHI